MTRSHGTVVGTEMYLPPEASSHGVLDPAQQDIFALGVTWYQLLVSKLERPPYDFAERMKEFIDDGRTIKLLSRCLAHPSRASATRSNWPRHSPTRTAAKPGKFRRGVSTLAL